MNVGASVSGHGTWAAYGRGCRCADCRAAARRYQKLRSIDAERGRPRTVDATGTRRRLQALSCLGWSFTDVGRVLGIRGEAVRQMARGERCWRSTAERIAEVYDALSMRVPVGNTLSERQAIARTRRRAQRLGWAPPLAWDEDTIDDPAAEPQMPPSRLREDDLDEVVVQRLIDTGRRERPLTHAEAALAYRRLRLRGVSEHEIERQYRLKPERYKRGVA